MIELRELTRIARVAEAYGRTYDEKEEHADRTVLKVGVSWPDPPGLPTARAPKPFISLGKRVLRPGQLGLRCLDFCGKASAVRVIIHDLPGSPAGFSGRQVLANDKAAFESI